MAINRHLLHVKSNQTVTTTVDNEDITRAKLPSPSNIEHGEIAINYHDGYETISIKNDNNEIVEFPNLNAVNILINEAMSGAQDALTFDETPTENSTNPVTSEGIKEYVDTGDSIQSLTTYETSTPLAVGDTHDEALSKLSKIIDDNETVVARALTELEDTKADKDDLYTKDEVDSLIEETNDSLTQIIEDNELTIATALNDLDSRISNMKGSIEELNEPSESTPLAVGDTYDDAFAKLTKIIRDDEEITARALTDLNETKQDEITDLDTIRSGAALGATALQSETQLSKGTATGDGNVVTDIAVNNHQITLTMGLTALTENALKTVNSLSLIGSGNIDAEDVILGKLVDNGIAKSFYRFLGTYAESQNPMEVLNLRAPEFSSTAEVADNTKLYVDILTQKAYWYNNNPDKMPRTYFTELFTVDLSSYADGAEYDSSEHMIYLKHGSTRLSNPIDATDFIKDGMVNSVRVDTLDDGSSDDGSDAYDERYLIITFNTDAGMEDIEIPLSDIFDPNLYYTKEEINEHELVTAAALTDLHDTKQDLLTFDDEPTEDSENPVTSGGVYDAINAIPEQLIDDVMVDQAYFEEHGANTFATANKRYNVLDVLELEDETTYNVGAGCEIHFWNEGMLSGNEGESSILALNNTLITGPMHKLFDDNVTFGGTMRNAECYPEWFGAVGDGVTDDADAINRCIYNAGYTPVVLNAMAYYVASSITMTESGFNTYINTYLGYAATSWGRNQQFIARHNLIGAPTLNGPVLIVESNGSICKVNGVIAVQNTGDSAVGFSTIKTTGADSGCQDMNIYIHGIQKGPKGDWYEGATTNDTYVSTWGVGHGTGAVLSSYGGYIVIDYIQGFEKGVHLARFYDTQLHVGQCEAIYCVYMGPVYGLSGNGYFVTRNKIFIGSQIKTQGNYCKYIVNAAHSSVVREIGDVEIAMNEITVGDSNGAANRRHPHKHSLYYTAGSTSGHTGNKYNFNITYGVETTRTIIKYEYASAPEATNHGIGNGDIINFGVSCYLRDIDIPYGWNVKLNNVLVSNSAVSTGSYRWLGSSGTMLIDTVTVSKTSTPIWDSAAQTINILDINPQHKGNVIATDTIPATCENNKFYVVDNAQVTITTNGTNKYPVYAKYFGTDATLIGYSLENYKEKQDVLTFDSTPTANSTNPVTSQGIKTYVDTAIGNLSNEIEELEEPLVSTPLAVGDTYDEAFAKLTKIIRDNELATAGVLTDLHDTKQDLLTFDDEPTEDSENPVTSDGIYTALDGKQDVLTFDDEPTEDSENPVTSGGVYAALSNVSTDHLTEVTYDELKTLRDDNELVSGMFYRITDYQCTTTQENTRSVGHQFDIVLLALDNKTLAEEGWAMMHDTPIYNVSFNGGERRKCYFYPTDDENCNLVDCNTLLGCTELINDIIFNEEDKTADYYDGDSTTDPDDYLINDSLTYNYFQNSNLSAWKVWYCLDNDTSRFAWAKETILDYDSDYFKRFAQADEQGYYAWKHITNENYIIYTITKTPEAGDTFYVKQGNVFGPDDTIFSIVPEGTGVIYRLIDEFNNDIKYDFKNIQFTRPLTDGHYDEDNGDDTWCYTLNLWYNDECVDASIVGNMLMTSDDVVVGVHDNKFGNCTNADLLNESTSLSFSLGNNVLLMQTDYGLFYGCYSNTIGNSFYNNTLSQPYENMIGNHCYNNVVTAWSFTNNRIGDYFNGNVIKQSTTGNVIGAFFQNNTIDDECYENVIGNGCSYNTIGSMSGNIIGYGFSYNNIGYSFSGNNVGNTVSDLYIGDGFQYSTIGNYVSSFITGTEVNNTITTIGYLKYICIEDGVNNVALTSSTAPDGEDYFLLNITIARGVQGGATRKVITHTTLNDTFKTTYQSANSQVVSV